jgi:tRNA threonylcarbamoyladenosine biosynthesis protein TsaB
MKFLCLDTSGPYSVVAVSQEDRPLCGSRRLFEKGRSDGLIELMTRCLKKARLRLDQVDAFGISIGPGSFTGLRIGLSTVKGLSYAFNKPCLPFSSLDAIAYNSLKFNGDRLCVAVDARRSNVYCRFYKRSAQKGLVPCSESDLINKDQLFKEVAAAKARGESFVFSGDALEIYKKELSGIDGDSECVGRDSWYPTPESVAYLTCQACRRDDAVDSVRLSAAYLYEKDCQVNRR